jgi:uncharacterized GH25 family protein
MIIKMDFIFMNPRPKEAPMRTRAATRPATLPVTAAALLLLAAPGSAAAHHIWLEPDGKSVRLCFGEFADNIRESSPGYLDKFPGPSGTHLSSKGEAKLTLTKTASAFTIPARVGKGESIIVEEANYPVLERKQGDKTTRTFWTPAARYITDFSAQAPRLALDIVPTGKTGEVQVVFRGKPLPKAEVEIVAPSGWALQKNSDDQGKVSFPIPWKGAYVVKVRQVENQPGKRPAAAGQPEAAYDGASLTTSLTFISATGMASPPPPPARASE